MDWIIGSMVVVALIAIAILMYKYLDGGFSYVDTIESQRRYEVTKTSYIGLGTSSVDFILRIVIKRHYANGKIKFITKEVKT